MQQVTSLDRMRHSVPPLLSGLAVVGLAVDSWRGNMLRDGDTYWHIRAGEWMLAHGQVLHQDPFSYTASGAPWVAHEWLSEIVMAAVYDWAGWSGLVGMTALLGGLTLYLFAAHVGRFVSALTTAALVFFAAFALLVVFLARPHLIALPLVEFWTAMLIIARSESRGPPWWLLPFMTLWANLHGGFLLGLALTGALGVEAMLADRPRWLPIGLRWGGFLAAASVASAITPNFPDGFLLPFRFIGMSTMFKLIGEWRAPDFQSVDPLEYTILAVMLFGFWRGLKLPPFRLLLLLGLVYSAFQHIRNEIMVGLMGPLLLAEPLGRHLGTPPFRKSGIPARLVALFELPIAVPVTIFLLVQLALDPVTRASDNITPDKALASVPEALRTRPVFNQYDFGGYLIFEGVRPFIDGRTDMYGGEFLKLYVDAANGNGKAVKQVLSKYEIAWSLMPAGSAWAAVLDASGWVRTYGDDTAVVQVRPDVARELGLSAAAPEPAATPAP